LKTKDAIERERDVILREMVEVNKIYEELILDQLHEIAYSSSGLGLTILGPEENIQKITQKDIQDYVSKHYTADRFVIAGAGAVDHDELVGITQEFFGKLPAPRNQPSTKTGAGGLMTKGVFHGGERRIRYDTMKVDLSLSLNLCPSESLSLCHYLCLSLSLCLSVSLSLSLSSDCLSQEAHLCIAYEGASWLSELSLPLMILQTIFGSWDRSIGSGGQVVSR
jgi:mitochondrial-processing peptidase subunit beta